MENERTIRILANDQFEQLERIRQSLLPDRKSIAFYGHEIWRRNIREIPL